MRASFGSSCVRVSERKTFFVPVAGIEGRVIVVSDNFIGERTADNRKTKKRCRHFWFGYQTTEHAEENTIKNRKWHFFW